MDLLSELKKSLLEKALPFPRALEIAPQETKQKFVWVFFLTPLGNTPKLFRHIA